MFVLQPLLLCEEWGCRPLGLSGDNSVLMDLHIADDIDGLAGEDEEEELPTLVECLDKVSAAYGMEISAEKTKYDK